jgi:hypothetical protein
MKTAYSLLAVVCALGLAACNTTAIDGSAIATPATQTKPMLTDAELRPLTAAEKIALGKMLAQSLKDPGSAQWQWTMFPKNADGSISYCAQVNAKNSYGGYNGFKTFISVLNVTKGKITAGAIAGIQDNDRRYSDIVPDMCRKEGVDPYKLG